MFSWRHGWFERNNGLKWKFVARDIELHQMEVCSDNLTFKLTFGEEKVPAMCSDRRI